MAENFPGSFFVVVVVAVMKYVQTEHFEGLTMTFWVSWWLETFCASLPFLIEKLTRFYSFPFLSKKQDKLCLTEEIMNET